LQADELGKLFTTLARDYRKMNRGRTLVVARLKTGTLFAELSDSFLLAAPFLNDVVEIAHAVDSMAKFAKTLWELHSVARDGKVAAPGESKFIGRASLDALADISANSNCEVSFEHKTKSETVKFNITPLEAVELRERTKLLEHRESERQKRLAVSHADRLPSIPHLTASLVDKLSTLQGTAGADQRPVAEAIAAVLQSMGHGHNLGKFAVEFEGRGLYALAASLRAIAKGSSGETEPPARV
jgi:hypothetical protein